MKQLNQLTSDQQRYRTLHFKEMTVFRTLEKQEHIAVVQLRKPITVFSSVIPHQMLTSDIVRIHLESLDDNVWIDEDAKIITGYFAFDVSKPSTNRSSMIYLVTTSFAERRKAILERNLNNAKKLFDNFHSKKSEKREALQKQMNAVKEEQNHYRRLFDVHSSLLCKKYFNRIMELQREIDKIEQELKSL